MTTELSETIPTADRIVHLTDQLSALPHLRPDPRTNALFGDLVHTVLSAPERHARDILAHEEVRRRTAAVRDLSARGETALEHDWAERIIAASDPHAALAAFPYLDNYVRLTALEVRLLRAAAGTPSAVAVVGCGPLPLTAFGYADALGCPVVGLDRAEDAVARARRVSARLGSPVRFERADAADADLAGYDAVVLAALVGETPSDKAAVLARMAAAMRPGAHLLARSAHGLRTLLYPPVDLRAMPGFEVLEVVHPTDDIINSVVVARRPER
ncbi:nicotianamine synthase family protein [Promicromonospora thailandica]|uniref:Nicotianamine synthase n=1 Tax=Promicromonospora thailandica TaxID=765201 RepID=A0A9X2JYE0_9MICO|nr:nicotianamine synthase family protein [Promicromonospora thailandica]MCP2264994.1 nicotianamine synthase [Promicromonospora thailandica]BFF18721.1 nicotianamine synthase family protein [Promicromonospora thailandica]